MKKWLYVLLIAALALPCALSESVSRYTPEAVRGLQNALYGMGYHSSELTGEMDEETAAALRAFQQANGLQVTGGPDSVTVEMLSSGTGLTCSDYLMNLTNRYSEYGVLQMGSDGDIVMAAQQILGNLGYLSGSADGLFGEATRLGVMRFQLANGLTCSGVLDKSTLLRLCEGTPASWTEFLNRCCCAEGDQSAYVRLIQHQLAHLGYFEGSPTGIFGEETVNAVRDFRTDNGLGEDGSVDVATCSALLDRVWEVQPVSLAIGADGEDVLRLQNRLSALGYFDGSITGYFGATTQTAVLLFQMANALDVTGRVDENMLSLLEGSDAVSLDDVRASFRRQVALSGDDAREALSHVVMNLRGQMFQADDEDLYVGFMFLEYACVRAGIPLISPDELEDLITEPVGDLSTLQSGEVLALHALEDGPVTLAVVSENGCVVYATQAQGWILETPLEAMDYAWLTRWTLSA